MLTQEEKDLLTGLDQEQRENRISPQCLMKH